MIRSTTAASPLRRRLLVTLGMLLALAVLATAPASLANADAGGGAQNGDTPRLAPTVERLAKRLLTHGPAAPGRTATPNSVYLPPTDSFVELFNGFDDPRDGCQPRGWTGQDLTGRVFGHVSSRFTINNGFVNMGTRAFWFGADSTSALDEIAGWVQPYGYANGWSQRLLSPKFRRAGNPGTTLRFDVSMELDRSLDNPATSTLSKPGPCWVCTYTGVTTNWNSRLFSIE